MAQVIAIMSYSESTIKGYAEDVCEELESMIGEKIGIYPMLQEDTEEGEFLLYLHTETYDDLDDDAIDKLDKLGITDNPEEATRAIMHLLNIKEFILM